MKILFISLLLGVIPLINWSLEYIFSKKNKKLKQFKSHLIARYADILFVLFNFLLLYSIIFNMNKFLFFLPFLFIFNLFMHSFWSKYHSKLSHHFMSNSGKIKSAGIVHFIFSIIQTAFILLFLFSKPISSFYYIGLLLLILFGLLSFVFSRKMHGKFIFSDAIILLGLVLISLVRFWMIY